MVTHWRNGGNCGSRIQELQEENHMKKQMCWKNNEGMAQNDLPPTPKYSWLSTKNDQLIIYP
jgi:hypothetical protein